MQPYWPVMDGPISRFLAHFVLVDNFSQTAQLTHSLSLHPLVISGIYCHQIFVRLANDQFLVDEVLSLLLHVDLPRDVWDHRPDDVVDKEHNPLKTDEYPKLLELGVGLWEQVHGEDNQSLERRNKNRRNIEYKNLLCVIFRKTEIVLAENNHLL